MRRWNGWGDDGVAVPLPPGGRAFLEERLGPGSPAQDATLAQVAGTVPPSRLPSHPLVATDAAVRVRHSRGQSLPDWVALRSGRVGAFADGVAFPETEDDVRTLLCFAKDAGARVIPYGGGTSVVGHVNVVPGEAPVLTVSLARLGRLRRLETTSRLATFEAGVAGPDLEAQLRARGFTLGHFPQSFEYSTLGGWVVTRSSGQQSLGYGRIERLFAGGRLVAPAGEVVLPSMPASAAGPDLRELVLGSEGRLGVLTEATVRVRPLPEAEEFRAAFLPDWERGCAAVRAMVQSAVPLSMLRLATPEETDATLRLAGRPRRVRALTAYLSWRGIGGEPCLLLIGLTGSRRGVARARHEALGLARASGAVSVGTSLGHAWKRQRFRGPYLRNTLWEAGYAADTLETAVSWDRLTPLRTAVEAALRGGLAPEGERVHVGSHVSHVYPDGASLYVTYAFRLSRDPEQTLARWSALKTAASRAIVASGGTISHQHGVGTDHAPFLVAEKGALGLAALGDVCRRLDPDGLLNPGKLLP